MDKVIPNIFVSYRRVGVSEPLDEAEVKRVGADRVLTKPFSSIRELIQTVNNLLGD